MGPHDAVRIRFHDAPSRRVLVLEDDGRVAYAYLWAHGELVADVWLYNVAATPKRSDWRAGGPLPLLNPASDCRVDEAVPRITDAQPSCAWSPDGVELFVGGVLVARLSTGWTPGESRLAIRVGPLARPLR